MNKLTLKELPDAVATYIWAKTNGRNTDGILDLIQQQTPFIEKRFWALVDKAVA